MGSWEARAMKLSRELSRTLKSLAEIERREQLKGQPRDPETLDMELEDADESSISYALRVSRGG